MKINTLKRKIKKGGVVIGSAIGIADPILVEILGYVGFDFVTIEAEHGAIHLETIERMVVSAYASNTVPIIKLPSVNRDLIQVGLDMGIMGVLVPHICTAEQVRQVVEAVRYPPEGKRGAGPGRPIQFGKIDLKEYILKGNDEIVIGIMIEDREGLDNIAEIVDVPGIDFVFIGPYDLSVSLNVPGEFSHPKIRKAIDDILNVARSKNITVGMPVGSAKEASYWVGKGIGLLGCPGAEDFIFLKYDEFLREIYNQIGGEKND